MRILHVSSLYPPHVVGGAERVVELLAERQAQMGHEVAVTYVSRLDEPGVRNGVATLPIKNSNPLWFDDVPRSPGWLRAFNKLVTTVNLVSASQIAGVVKRFAPDVVHTHSMVALSPLVWRAATRTGCALVHTLHDYDMVCLRATLFNHGHNCIERRPACEVTSLWKARFAGAMDAVVGVSQAVLDEHVVRGALAGIDPTKLSVIWNGAALDPQPRATKPVEQPFTFGFIGRLVPEKGVEVLLEACRRLPSGGWRLRVAGKAPGHNPYLAVARDLPVDFVGFTEPGAFLDSIDVLVAPSVWREPFGLTVVEAFARGAPVIGARQGAISDLIETAGLGAAWITPPGDVATLANVMIQVLGAGRNALPSASGFASVLDAVSPERMARAYDTTYVRAMANRRAKEG